MGAGRVCFLVGWTGLLFGGLFLITLLHLASDVFHTLHQASLTALLEQPPSRPAPLDLEPKEYISRLWNKTCNGTLETTLVSVHCFYLADRLLDEHPPPPFSFDHHAQHSYNTSLRQTINAVCTNQPRWVCDWFFVAIDFSLQSESLVLLVLACAWFFFLFSLLYLFLYYTYPSASPSPRMTVIFDPALFIATAPVHPPLLLSEEDQAYNKDVRLRKNCTT